MKFKPFILSLAVLTAFTFSACDGVKESSQPTETTSSTTSLSIFTEEIEYNGTFNEDIFNQICQNIKVEDVLISFPCTTRITLKHFNWREPIIIEESKVVNYQLCYNETDLGSCSFSYTEDPEDFDNLSMTGLGLNRDENLVELISVGEITFQYSKQQIIDRLGEPLIVRIFKWK